MNQYNEKTGEIIPRHFVTFKGVYCEVLKHCYGSGQIALVLVEVATEQRFAVASSCINGPLEPNQTAIKNYSENEGIHEVLEKANIIKDLGIGFCSGFVELPIVEVLI